MQVTHGNLDILRKWKRKIYIEYIYIYNIALRFYMNLPVSTVPIENSKT